jgi:signal transduction histidine kinase
VLAQVAALAALAVLMSQAVAFAVVLLAPDPRPAGFGLDAAADALMGRPAETSDGRALRRRLSDRPTVASADAAADPLALALTAALARRTGTDIADVRVAIDHAPRRHGGPAEFSFIQAHPHAPRANITVVRRPPPAGPVGDAAAGPESAGVRTETHMRHAIPGREGAVFVDATTRRFTVLADRLTFAPFSASVKLADGRWATVEPPRSLISPWQRRVLLGLVISMLLLAPLVWWMARRLTQPIRVFADAAERLGADPDAEPLTPSGPSEVRTAIAAFNEMQGKLRGHMRQRTQTIAAIAHDLRTPLTRLRFRAEQAPPAVRERMAADIEEMDALIGQAMAFVRGETTPERRERFDLATLAADCATGFAETGAEVSFSDGDALPVEADPAALRRALANLIANAVKYGGAARVRTARESDQAAVLIDDDGPGLPDAELETVFEPFHRAERSRNRETGGAGLGLTVARQAARAAGGDVTLGNRPQGGLTAKLQLPLAG